MNASLPKECAAALSRHLRPEVFKALCDPTRLALIAHLAEAADPVTVTEASDCCAVHLSGVSRHLSMLRQAGIVEAEKQGREVSYRLNAEALVQTLRGLADAVEECCRQHSCCQTNRNQNRNPNHGEKNR